MSSRRKLVTGDASGRTASSRAHKVRGANVRPSSAKRVFVYGTLLAGETNHRLLAHARFIAETRTQPLFELRDLGPYPGLVHGGEHAIVGELYEVDESTLAELDRLEGHPLFYQRTPIALEDGDTVETYLLPREHVEGLPLISSGSWRSRDSCFES